MKGETPLPPGLTLDSVIALVDRSRLIPKSAPGICCVIDANLEAPVEEGPTTVVRAYRRGADPTKDAPVQFAILRVSRTCKSCKAKHRFFMDQELPEAQP